MVGLSNHHYALRVFNIFINAQLLCMLFNTNPSAYFQPDLTKNNVAISLYSQLCSTV